MQDEIEDRGVKKVDIFGVLAALRFDKKSLVLSVLRSRLQDSTEIRFDQSQRANVFPRTAAIARGLL